MTMLLKLFPMGGITFSIETLISQGCLSSAINNTQYVLAVFAFMAMMTSALLLYFAYFGNTLWHVFYPTLKSI
jgi:hypothetical protein